MSLINEALKKAGQDAGGDDTLENAYPQKVFFLAGRQTGNHRLITLAAVLLLGAAVVAALQVPSVTQRLLRLVGAQPVPASTPRLPVAASSPAQPVKPGVAGDASKAQAERHAQLDQLIQAGTAALQAGNVTAARTAFTKAIQSDSTSAVAHHGLGLVEKRAGNLAGAEQQYLEAIRLNANDAEVRNNLALLYDQQGKADRAIVEYTAALSLRPNYPEARLNYAIALERVGRSNDAKSEYQKFLTSVPPELRDVAEKVQAHLSSLL
jgi:Tfp pilus assembly protein PilF